MKKAIKIIISVFILCMGAFSIVNAQGKNPEQKIKIVVADDTGEKVILDTLISDSNTTDSIRLKDGRVIFIGNSFSEKEIGSDTGNKYVFVTTESDGNEPEKEIRKIMIVSSDSSAWEDEAKSGKTSMHWKSSETAENDGLHKKVITVTEVEDSGGPDEKIIIIKKGNGAENIEVNSLEHSMVSPDIKAETERTKYVIKRDGLVISVEGDDYNRVKDLVRDIESTLDAKNEGNQDTKVLEEKNLRK